MKKLFYDFCDVLLGFPGVALALAVIGMFLLWADHDFSL